MANVPISTQLETRIWITLRMYNVRCAGGVAAGRRSMYALCMTSPQISFVLLRATLAQVIWPLVAACACAAVAMAHLLIHSLPQRSHPQRHPDLIVCHAGGVAAGGGVRVRGGGGAPAARARRVPPRGLRACTTGLRGGAPHSATVLHPCYHLQPPLVAPTAGGGCNLQLPWSAGDAS